MKCKKELKNIHCQDITNVRISRFLNSLGKILKIVDAERGVMFISLTTFMVICSMYALQLSTAGYLFISQTSTTTLWHNNPSMIFVLFTAGYISIFFAFLMLQILNNFVNQSSLVFISLVIGIIGGLAMLNYDER